MNVRDNTKIKIRRQWNDWRIVEIEFSISNLHWDNISGGVVAPALQYFIHGYVWCDRYVGDLAHSCMHGKGFFGSFLQTYYSNRPSLEKDHLYELKEIVCNPLSKELSKPDFTILDLRHTFAGIIQSGEIVKIVIDNLLVTDFMENHYPEIFHDLKDVIKSKAGLDTADQRLRNRLKSTLSNTFSKMAEKKGKEDTFNEESLDTLVSAIINGIYYASYLRVTEPPNQ